MFFEAIVSYGGFIQRIRTFKSHFLVGQFMFRYHHKMLPKIFDVYFIKHSAIHQYSTTQSDL